jgi:broad specificity phosphatase PhoE
VRTRRCPRNTAKGSLAAIAVLVLGVAGCTPADDAPSPTVSPTGQTTTVLVPTATTTTVIVVTPYTTTIGATSQPAPTTTAEAAPTTTVQAPPTTTQPSTQPTVEQAQWTFVVVRHANWKDNGTADPPLTVAGVLRARRLADLINSYAGVATYATHFRRAEATAHPTADLWNVPVTTYDIAMRPADLINQIKQQHPKGAILIVGHSNTVPGIVRELCRCQLEPVPSRVQNDYANKYEITLRPDSSVLRVAQWSSY